MKISHEKVVYVHSSSVVGLPLIILKLPWTNIVFLVYLFACSTVFWICMLNWECHVYK